MTEEEKKAAKREYSRQYYKKNRDKIKKQTNEYYYKNIEKINEYKNKNQKRIKKTQKRWRDDNKNHISEYNKEYSQTSIGRAHNLISSYKTNDRKHNRGECTLTAKWIVNNIFTQKCVYCGESDWTKLGCDRIDNSKPHTENNVVPCCKACNDKRGTKTYEQFLAECTKKDLG